MEGREAAARRARRPTRRGCLAGAAAGAAALVGARFALPRWWRAGPLLPVEGELRAFVDACFEGLERSLVWDVHAHLVGLGAGGTGCEVSPRMRSHLHPVLRFQYDVYTAAAGITDEAEADRQYLDRLLALHRAANPAGKLLLFAFDRRVNADGSVDPEGSPFYTPNEYVLRVARENEDVVPCASVHPYRADALERLDRALEGGARALKWLPNAMAIDPADARCDAFYERLAERGIPLITHAGKEMAVDSEGLQELGNPLRLRRALDAGVRVVVAHFASLGESADLDGDEGERRESFELCMRLFRESRYEELLFADVSAVTFVNRMDVLPELLRSRELQPRLLNGSDYPLPAVDPIVSTRRLVSAGLLEPEDRRLCNAAFDANPLLFDFVVKRRVGVTDGGRRLRFAPGVFETGRFFGEPG